MPILLDFRKISCQKLPQNQSDKKSNVTDQNSKYWNIEYSRGIYTFFSKAGLNTNGSSNKSAPKTFTTRNCIE